VTEWLEACMDSPPYWYSIPLWQRQGREGIALKRTCLEEVESMNPSLPAFCRWNRWVLWSLPAEGNWGSRQASYRSYW